MNKVKDISGQKFGRLTVIERDTTKQKGRSWWICRCECGNIGSYSKNRLTSGKTTSCGCARKKVNFIDISGQKFGRLTAIKPVDTKTKSTYDWICQCECGNTCIVSGAALRSGGTKSCGCLIENSLEKLIKAGQEARKDYYVDGTDVFAVATGRVQQNNTSGCPGVSYDKSVQLWKATIIFRGKRYYLGSSADIQKCISLRKEAEKHIWGEFLLWYEENYPEQWKRIKEKNK